MTWSEFYSTTPQLLLIGHAINHLCQDDFFAGLQNECQNSLNDQCEMA
jgi:hypothetical protein